MNSLIRRSSDPSNRKKQQHCPHLILNRRGAQISILTLFAAGLLAPITAANNAYASEVTVNIRYLEIDGSQRIGRARISVVPSRGGGCAYRLEYDDPDNRPNWAVHEVAGDRGPLQRYNSRSCRAPAFTVRRNINLPRFDAQTAYYWIMLARDYAISNLWVTPPGWSDPPIKHSTKRVDPYVLTDGGIGSACWPNPRGGCFRAWPHEGPRIYLRERAVSAHTIAHEYGHYATGYVFGHMDTLGFRFNECAKRAFQEATAEMFADAFEHSVRHAMVAAENPVQSWHNRVWNGRCGANNDDYVMGRPLEQAFKQALWGRDWSGTVTVPWQSPAAANKAMITALSYALAKNRGHLTEEIAKHIVEYITDHQEDDVSSAVRRIFVRHGFLNIGDACTGNVSCTGPRTTRCDNTVRPYMCIPDDGEGRRGEYCTHNNHCDARSGLVCRVTATGRSGTCGRPARREIGDRCASNPQCNGNRTSRCDDTVRPFMCIPDDGTGRRNEYCTHNNQCNARFNLVCRVSAPGGSGSCRR